MEDVTEADGEADVAVARDVALVIRELEAKRAVLNEQSAELDVGDQKALNQGYQREEGAVRKLHSDGAVACVVEERPLGGSKLRTEHRPMGVLPMSSPCA